MCTPGSDVSACVCNVASGVSVCAMRLMPVRVGSGSAGSLGGADVGCEVCVCVSAKTEQIGQMQ